MNSNPKQDGDVSPSADITEIKRFANYTLLVPIERASDNANIKEIVMRRPKGRELRSTEKLVDDEGAMYATFQLVADLSGLTLKDIDEMDAVDVANLSKMAEDFLPKRPTGAA